MAGRRRGRSSAQSSIGYRMPLAAIRTGRSGRTAGSPAGPAAAGLGPHVEPALRASAIRSPRTALVVAAPPAPGPSNATRPTGSASTSIRLRTPAVRPSADPSGSAVGRTAAAIRPSSAPADAVATRRMISPARLRVLLVGQADGRDAGPAGPSAPSGRVATVAGSSHALEGEPGQDHQLVDGVERPRRRPMDRPRRSPAACASASAAAKSIGCVCVGHRGQDEVGRAVDDAADALDAVRREVDGQRPEDGDPAADGGLEAERRRRSGGRVASSSGPWWATTCLLAVTTGLPIASAAAISVWAGSSPPISSTMTSTSGSATRCAGRIGQQRRRECRPRRRDRRRGRRRAASSRARPSAAPARPFARGARGRPRARRSPRRGPRRGAGCRS